MGDLQDFLTVLSDFVETTGQKEIVKQVSLKIQCPHCEKVCKWNDKYINRGWTKIQCNHCKNEFAIKIHISSFDIQTKKHYHEL